MCSSTSPSSEGTDRLARELELRVVDFALVEEVDYLFDGADEVDSQLRMLKGSGGAMTRERIIRLGEQTPGLHGRRQQDGRGPRHQHHAPRGGHGLRARQHPRLAPLRGPQRRLPAHHGRDLFITDNGNLILDVPITPDHCLEELAAHLNDIPGVIDHGLFLGEADEILVDRGGKVERMLRQD
ncbi:MAG: ribose-5-phosphate isomerase A [Sphingomonadales bacterium]|nr:ribose-5-phosphate isomerase A [Sphingomonadales bacterium]